MKVDNDSKLTVTTATVVEATPVEGGTSLSSKLADLSDALQQGLLTQQEYESAKKDALSSFTGGGGGGFSRSGNIPVVSQQPKSVAREVLTVTTPVSTSSNSTAAGSSSPSLAPGLLSTEDIAGSYWCCCFAPPFGYGWTNITAEGPNKIHQTGCCVIGALPCVGGEVRERVPNTNSFRNIFDHGNVTTFNSNSCALNGCSALCKLTQHHGEAARFRHIRAEEIAGNWCCYCWFPGMGCASFNKIAVNDNELTHKGLACWQGCPIPFEETRFRVPGTNGFKKADDEKNVDWYLTPDLVGNGCSVSCKC